MSAQLTLFFRDQTGYGWSEKFNYVLDSSSSTVVGDVDALITGRAAILTSSCTITHARMNTTRKRDPVIFSLSGGMGTPGAETPPTAPSEVALLVRLAGVTQGYARPFLRGIPLRVIGADQYIPDATFTANLNSFFTVLENGDWEVVGTLGGSPTQFVMVSPAPSSPKGYSFNTPVGSAFLGTAGQLIRVHGCKVPGYNGLKTIMTADNVNRLYVVGGASPPTPDTGARPYVTVPGNYSDLIGTCAPEGITRRGAGRPFGLSRGRRQTLYSQRQ